MAEFEKAVDYVLGIEGGLSDNPKDPGGITKYGISLRFLKSIPEDRLNKMYGIAIADEEAIRNLTVDQAKCIYKGEFWNHAPFEKISNQFVGNIIFDTAINMGIAPAIKCVQRAIWAVNKERSIVKDDGILGDKTLRWINICGIGLIPAIRSERAGDYRVIAKGNENAIEFINGWLNRAYEK